MKNFFKILFCALIVLNYGCSDDDELPVDFDDLNVSGEAYTYQTSVAGLTSINKNDIGPAILSGFSKSYELNSLQNGTDVSLVELYVGFTGDQLSVNEALYLTIPSSQFNNSSSRPGFDINFVWSDILALLGLTLNDLEGGDTFNFRFAITNQNGTFSDVSANFDNQSADHKFSSSVVCLVPPIPGDWTLDMTDLYGDGWNGGEITINLEGIVTTYSAAGAFTSETITVPVGTNVLTVTYTSGDWEGENLYTLTNPNGTVVLDEGVGDFSRTNGPPTGERLNPCP